MCLNNYVLTKKRGLITVVDYCVIEYSQTLREESEPDLQPQAESGAHTSSFSQGFLYVRRTAPHL